MALKGKTRILQSLKAHTQYVSIPSVIVRDSQYPFKGNDEVEISVDPIQKKIEIKKRED